MPHFVLHLSHIYNRCVGSCLIGYCDISSKQSSLLEIEINEKNLTYCAKNRHLIHFNYVLTL